MNAFIEQMNRFIREHARLNNLDVGEIAWAYLPVTHSYQIKAQVNGNMRSARYDIDLEHNDQTYEKRQETINDLLGIKSP